MTESSLSPVKKNKWFKENTPTSIKPTMKKSTGMLVLLDII